MMQKFFILSLLCVGLLSTNNLFALATNDMGTAQKLAETILGDNVTISNVTYHGAHDTAGTFDDGIDSIGIEHGIILSSGVIHRVVGPNLSDGMHHTDHSNPGDPDLDALIPGNKTQDATVLEFDFILDLIPGNSREQTTVTFQYVFASEEYNEYVNNKFNDIFAGHHATETVGVKALSKVVAKELEVETIFVDIPTGL